MCLSNNAFMCSPLPGGGGEGTLGRPQAPFWGGHKEFSIAPQQMFAPRNPPVLGVCIETTPPGITLPRPCFGGKRKTNSQYHIINPHINEPPVSKPPRSFRPLEGQWAVVCAQEALPFGSRGPPQIQNETEGIPRCPHPIRPSPSSRSALALIQWA